MKLRAKYRYDFLHSVFVSHAGLGEDDDHTRPIHALPEQTSEVLYQERRVQSQAMRIVSLWSARKAERLAARRKVLESNKEAGC